MSQVIKATTEEQFKEATSNGVVLVDLFAEWCGPCKMLAPVLDEVSESGIKVVKVDSEELPVLAGQLGVMSVPTIFVMKDGEVVERTTGFKPAGFLTELVENHS
jgi:thioredoxin 1